MKNPGRMFFNFNNKKKCDFFHDPNETEIPWTKLERHHLQQVKQPDSSIASSIQEVSLLFRWRKSGQKTPTYDRTNLHKHVTRRG